MPKTTLKKRLKPIEQLRKPTQAKTLQEVLNPEQTAYLNRMVISLPSYIILSKLAVDHKPLMKLHSYCAMILEDHAQKAKGY